MKINSKLEDGKWVKYNEKVQFKIRAFPVKNLMLVSDSMEHMETVGLKICDYCVTDWKGFEDEEGKEFKYSDENKTYLFNYYPAFIEFISKEVEKLKNVSAHTVRKTLKK